MRISDWSSDVCSSDLHDTGNAEFDLGKRLSIKFDLCAALMVLAVELLRIGTHGVSDRIGGNELFRQSRQNAALDVVAADGMAIIAGAPAITVQANISVKGDDAGAATAASAFEQPGEQRSEERRVGKEWVSKG